MIPDDIEIIGQALRNWQREGRIIVLTGGLGPTSDDCTREAIAAYLGVPLQTDDEGYQIICQRMRRFNRIIPRGNQKQAMIPAGARAIFNPKGLALGIWADFSGGSIVALPGVPTELEAMWLNEVEPQLFKINPLPPKQSCIRRMIGIGESSVAEKVSEKIARLSIAETCIGYYPSMIGVDLVYSPNGAENQEFLDWVDHEFADYCYSRDEKSLVEIFADLCRRSQITLATAESCTAGLLGKLITDLPGSSAFYQGGIIAYSNSAKLELLGINSSLIETYGAVSEQTARAMAESVIQRLGCCAGIAITGIAGPEGGTTEKPVGTVWIATKLDNCIETHLLSGGLSRDAIRHRSAYRAIFSLLKQIQQSVN